MKKRPIWLVRALILLPLTLVSQTPEMPELPNVIPPSPTVANLMAFEETPVNHYTGTPDISIPIYQTTGYGGYPINVSISYNPSGITVGNIASWVGNGWSLNAGGAVSRTVYGKPDDTDGGMLNNSFMYPSFPITEEIMFDTNVNDTYDTETDLFQFNFMGRSGRFYIKRTSSVNFEVVQISANSKYVITPTFSGTFNTITSFQITDDSGYV